MLPLIYVLLFLLSFVGAAVDVLGRFYDVVHTERKLTLVFEYLDQDLKKYLDVCDGGLESNILKSFLYQLLRGIAYCHHHRVWGLIYIYLYIFIQFSLIRPFILFCFLIIYFFETAQNLSLFFGCSSFFIYARFCLPALDYTPSTMKAEYYEIFPFNTTYSVVSVVSCRVVGEDQLLYYYSYTFRRLYCCV